MYTSVRAIRFYKTLFVRNIFFSPQKYIESALVKRKNIFVQFTSTSIPPAVRVYILVCSLFEANGKNQIVRWHEANARAPIFYKMLLIAASGVPSCAGLYMESGYVAVFLGFKYLWYLLFREQTQASENPREHTQRHRYSIWKTETNTSFVYYYKNRHLL